MVAPAQAAKLPEVSRHLLLMNSPQEQKQSLKMPWAILPARSVGSGKQQETVIYDIIKPE